MQQFLAKYICRYTCNSHENIQKKEIYFWNKTISEKCCLDSKGNVFKAGNIMNKIPNMDKCQSLILSRCTILPGEMTFMITKFHFNCFWCLVHCIVAKIDLFKMRLNFLFGGIVIYNLQNILLPHLFCLNKNNPHH